MSTRRARKIDGVTLERARGMRAEPTRAERRLWFLLRGRQFEAFKFRRQYPIGRFIVDFCCARSKLAIELDGGQHSETKDYDAVRTEAIERLGFTVIRFWNHQVLENSESLVEEILRVMREQRRPSKPSPAQL